jgi:hypothetical protein
VKFYNVLSALSEELGTETKHYIQYEISLEIFVRRVKCCIVISKRILKSKNSRDDTVDTTSDKQDTMRYHQYRHQFKIKYNDY